jgi:hypothetical protein
MQIEYKIAIIFLEIFSLPFIGAAIFSSNEEDKSFWRNYFYSLAACLIVVVLEVAGKNVVFEFIENKTLSVEDSFIYILRVSAVYMLASIGGAPLIAKVFEFLFNQKLEINRKINDIGAKAEKAITSSESAVNKSEVAVQIAFSDNEKPSAESNLKTSLRDLLVFLNTHPDGFGVRNIPQDLAGALPDAIKMHAVTTKTHVETLDSNFVISDFGKSLLSK